MKKAAVTVILFSLLFCISPYPAYSEGQCPVAGTSDVNNDGMPDVVYYGDGEHIIRAEADTNYDGTPDLIVHTQGGKFKSAEADTDYDGTYDKQFNDVAEFNKWLNDNNPAFNDRLNKDDWRVDIMRF